MIDVRDLDAIDIESIFRGSSSSDDQIVTIAYRRIRDPGIRANDTSYILVGTWYLIDIAQADDSDADRTLHTPKERRRLHRGSSKFIRIQVHFDLYERRIRSDPIFGRHHSPVTELDGR